MKLVYLNNFRGFNNSFVEIKDVNFFIGENSTGKTSVLKILRALLNMDFWSTANMDLSMTDLGYFHEINSDLGDNSSFFEIGIFDEIEQSGIKLKYSEENGRPIISEVGFLSTSINAEFINLRSDLKFRYLLNPQFEVGQEIRNFFEDWVKKNGLGTEKFIEVSKEEKKFNLNFPIFFTLLMQIQKVISENNLSEFRPFYGRSIYWFAPIRTNPQRIYDAPNSEHSPDGAHTPFLLRDYLMAPGNDSAKEKKKRIEFILNKFGADSGLFELVSIKQYENSVTSPFQLQITINGRKLNYTNVGYGVSQILPLLVEIIVSPEGSIFSIQQPEVHLHPRGQAAFGDFLFKSFKEESKRFIIETHSDYLIDRFRIRLSKCTGLNDDINLESHVVFFSKGNKGNHMTSIPIGNDGGLPDDQPKEYRDFFIKEQFDLLDI